MNKKNLELINEYVNSLSVVKGGNMLITEHGTYFRPKDPSKGGMKYEDCEYVHVLVNGARDFLYFLERGNYDIKRQKKVETKTP